MKYILLILVALLFAGCNKSSDPAQDKKEIAFRKSLSCITEEVSSINKEKNNALEKYIDSLSPVDMVRELFIVNLEGNKVFHPIEKKSQVRSDFSDEPLVPGGYIFFSYNLSENIEDIMYFTDSIRNFCVSKGFTPPYLSLDQEGGFVNRLRTINGPLPSSKRVKQNLSLEKAYSLYSLQAVQMKALGFDMNLAPVSEVETNENADFLNGRSFGSASDVLDYSRVFVNSMQNSGIATVLKHFPGNTNVDPHSGLPEITLPYERLMDELSPFRNLVSYSPSCVLMSHARTSALDSDFPACLSEKWVKGVLRSDFGFDGIVFSDDIFMKALSDNGYPPEKAVVMAINAGVDVIMISEKRFASSCRVLLEKMEEDEEFKNEVKRACRHVLIYKINSGLLKYVRTSESVSSYSLVPSSPYGKITDRIVWFRDAYDENVNFYINNFR